MEGWFQPSIYFNRNFCWISISISSRTEQLSILLASIASFASFAINLSKGYCIVPYYSGYMVQCIKLYEQLSYYF